jgi:hypothetical protein
MADFSYTTTQSIVAPNAPTLQATVSTDAANTFKNLSGIFDAYQQAKTAEIKGDINIINVQRAEASRKATQARAEKKLADDEQALVDKGTAREIKSQASFLARNFEQDMASQPDMAMKEGLFMDFMTSLSGLTTDVNDVVYDKVFDSIKSYQEKYNTQFVDISAKYRKEQATLDLRGNIPAYLEMPLEQQKQSYTDNRDLALAAGYTEKEFGDFWVKGTSDYIVSQLRINEEDLQNDYGYAQIDSAYNALEALQSVDKRLVDKQVILDAKARVDTIKNSVDSVMKSNFETAVAEMQQDDFKRLAALGLQTGAFGEDYVNSQAKELAANYVSSGKMARDNANSLMSTTGGTMPVELITDEKTRTAYKSQLTTKLTQMMAGQIPMDANFIRTSAATNKSVFTPVFNKAIDRTLSTTVQQAMAKTAENPEQIVLSGIMQANQLAQFAGNAVPNKTRVRLAVAETLVLSGKIDNISDALRTIGNLEEFTPFNSNESGVKELTQELPLDQQEEAIAVYSALVKSNQMSQEEALEVAMTTYSFDSYDDIDFQMSGKVVEYLETMGITPNKFKYLQKVLTDEEMDVLPEAERTILNKIMAGEDATVQVQGNNLYFRNSDNESYLLQLNPQQKGIITDSVNVQHDLDNEVVGIQRMVDDGMKAVAKDASRAYEIIDGFVQGATAPYVLLGQTINPEWTTIGDGISNYTSGINRTIDGMYRGTLTEDEAKDALFQLSDNFTSTVGSAWTKEQPAEWKAFIERSDNLKESLRALPFDDMADWLGTRMSETLQFIIPSAEASSQVELPYETDLLSSLADREAPKKNGVPFLQEGAIHQGQEEGDAPTTNYGVRIDKFPKLENETDREHALRYFNQEFKPFLDKLDIKGVDPMQFASMTWNTGITNSPLKSLNGLDLNKPEHQQRAFSNIMEYVHTTESSGKVWSTGLLNARLADWNGIAEVVNPNKKVTAYQAVKDNDGQTFIFYRLADGTGETSVLNKPLSSSSKMQYGKLISVK